MIFRHQTFDLPLKHRFTIAHQSREIQETLIVTLEDGEDYGLGESTTNPYYGMTLDNMHASLEAFRPIILGGQWTRPEELWELGKDHFFSNPLPNVRLTKPLGTCTPKKKEKNFTNT